MVTGAALIAADWSTTAYGLAHGGQEANPLVGPHPTQTTLAAFELVHFGLYALAVRSKVAHFVVPVVVFIEGLAVTHNLELGAAFGLP